MIRSISNPTNRIAIWRFLLALLLASLLALSAGAMPAAAAKPVKPQPVTTVDAPKYLNLLVAQDGIYRATYEELRAAGLDLAGVNSSDISLSLRGVAVPIYIQSGRQFGPGAFIEFYGQALDTLYTKTNIYQLQVNRKLASRIALVQDAPPAAAPLPFYMEVAKYTENKAYNASSPLADPWYHTAMFVATAPNSWNFTIELADYLPGVGPVSLALDIYGKTETIQLPDHHTQLFFNSQGIADVTFDGVTSKRIDVPNLPVSQALNTLTITLPGDTGAAYDGVMLEGFTITYPRLLLARQGRLQFSAAAPLIQVDGFDSPDISAYRLRNGIVERFAALAITSQAQGYRASFAGSDQMYTYFAASAAGLLHPGILPGKAATDISSGSFNYIMISHPDFIAGLAPLVQARQAQGYTVKVVNVEDIYSQYNFGVVDPQSIRSYIAHAKNNMGAQYILLIGADTYDYFNNLQTGQRSFIPTLYAQTDRYTRFSPVDPLYADVNGDNMPDLALGRLPVRNLEQLNAAIAKTLAFKEKSYNKKTIFASDVSFSGYVSDWGALLPGEWIKEFANLDQLPVADARRIVLENMNNGAALVNYFGHSAPTVWTGSGLFTTNDVPALNNLGKPFLVAQYGCWNSYFVDPQLDSLGQQFLFADNKGAAAVVGSTTNNYVTSQYHLGKLLTANLATPGMTIGQALLSAKQMLTTQLRYFPEIVLGWSILGDPTLVVTP